MKKEKKSNADKIILLRSTIPIAYEMFLVIVIFNIPQLYVYQIFFITRPAEPPVKARSHH